MNRIHTCATWIFYVLTILVIPVLYIPTHSLSLVVLQKYLFLTIVATLVSGYFVYQRFISKELKISVPLFILTLFLASSISTLLSYDVSLSFIGDAASLYTWSTMLSLVLIYLGTRIFPFNRNVYTRILTVLMGVSAILATFHVLRIFVGREFISLGIFNFVTQNTIGESSDLAVYALLSVFVSIYLARESTRWITYLSIYALFANIILVICFNFNIVTGVPFLYVATVGMFVFAASMTRKRVLAALSVSIFLIASIFSNVISRQVVSLGDFEFGETTSIQVSVPASFDVVKNVYGDMFGQMLLGVGPNTYPMIWARYKPVSLPDSINITEYWDYDFRESFSSVLTHVTAGGLITLLSLVLVYLYVGRIVYNAVFSEDDILVLLGSLTGILWVLQLIYTPGIAHVVLALVFLGVTGGIVRPQKKIWFDIEFDLKGVLYVSAIVFLCISSMYVSTRTIYAYIGGMYADKALSEVEKIHQGANPDLETAVSLLETAISKNPLDEYKRFLVDLRLYMIENKIDVDIHTLDAEAANLIGEKGDSVNFRNWIQFGRVQELKTMLGSTTTAPIAYTAYVAASNLAPTHPLPQYMLARVHVYAGNLSLADRELRKALLLKPNYREALSLYNEIHATSSKSSGKMGR
ncbi:MAG: hypothetical protein FGM57_00430 [Candidatus Taylorbacteria bacterium]|nr:hypothetical protein [Candidatus Taylorbacteria bacterium]